MNISSTTAATSTYAAASSPRAPDASARESTTPDASPDVVVTLGAAVAPSATYDASGRFPGGPPAASADGGDSDDDRDGDGGVDSSDAPADTQSATTTDEAFADA